MGRAITSDMCTNCGGCCRNSPFVELSDEEMERLRAFTGLEATDFSDSDRALVPRRFLRFQASGSCVFLAEDSGRAVCRVYDARPGVCRSYPFTASQEKECEATWRKREGYRSG